jgi:hypothetical protein
MAAANASGATNSPAREGLSSWDHALYGLLWAGFVAVAATAAMLSPDPSGLGTHTHLHLPPCGFYLVFEKPCPSCGMTTAFSWMMHGQPVRAFKAQPAGVAVFLSGLALWLYLPIAWARRRPAAHLLDLRATLPVVLTLNALILGVWIWRLVRW